MSQIPRSTPDADCEGCPLVSSRDDERTGRRQFLRRAALLLGSLGLATTRAPEALAFAGAATRLPHSASDSAGERRYAIPPVDSVQIDADNSLIIAHAGSQAFAFSLACPHQNTALRWHPEDHEFKCPKHKSRYKPDGVFIDGRATRSMDRLAIRREGAELVVGIDTMYRQDEQAAQWAAAVVAV